MFVRSFRALPPLIVMSLALPLLAQAPAGGNQSLHILVGRSILVNSQARYTRIVVGNPDVVDTVTTTPTQVVVTAKTAGSSSLILWDETGRTRVFDVYADIDVASLRDAIQQTFPNQQVQIEAQESKVILTGIVSNQGFADQMIAMAKNYSKDVVNSLVTPSAGRQKQIMLKVRFAEVDRSKIDSFGVNILSTGAANTPGVITTQQFGSIGLGGGTSGVTGTIGGSLTGSTTELRLNDLLNIFLFRPDLNLGVAIRNLQNKNALQILAEPNLMSLSGEKAQFLAGGEFPYPVIQAGTGTNTVTIQFRPFGVKLEFVGTIEKLENGEEVVRLKVSPEVSSLDYTNSVTISGFLLPAISTRRAETQIELRNNQSFGIAGLMDARTTAQLSKVPGIGDIPILGHLFRSRSLNRSKTELLVLVTPTIVDPLTATGAPEDLALPMKGLDVPAYDKSLPGNKNPESQPK